AIKRCSICKKIGHNKNKCPNNLGLIEESSSTSNPSNFMSDMFIHSHDGEILGKAKHEPRSRQALTFD
ncbi:7096_t:CDS:2, partial [Scutellospora calospora]